ncbi:MAG: flagellar basal-body MS-ring/collar protein FliF [Pseudomonadales bacterium]|nr:flagellar basal-body MS-ring/collar protein FliF [Pseudomonadales bacterium]
MSSSIQVADNTALHQGSSQPLVATGEDARSPNLNNLIKSSLGLNSLVPLLIAGAAVIAVIAALMLWANSSTYRVLFSNLSEADGGRIINELDTRGIPYRFSEGGNAILVPAENVHSLRLQLAEQGLPQGGGVGFELLDNQAFGVSQFTEQVNFQRGLEGELARSIESLGPVAQARVHLALPRLSVFVRDREPAKASAVLSLHPGRSLGKGQASAITHLISSSVPNLAAENVTLLDQLGNLLSSTGTGDNPANGNLEYIKNVERSYQERIENILGPLFGSQNIRVQVAAQLDLSTREQTSERFNPENAAVRSSQLSGDLNGTGNLAAGVPGALSNTPPGTAPSPLDLAAANTGADGANPADNNLRYDNLINYELDRDIIHTQHQRGQVERLTVAVVVNYRDALDEDGLPVREALSEAEMEQVNRLVRQAMGFVPARGDEVEVANIPFTLPVSEDIVSTPWWQTPTAMALALSLGRYLLTGLLALALYRMLIRPLLNRHLATVAPARALAGPGSAPADDDEFQDSTPGAGGGHLQSHGPGMPRKRKTFSYEQNLKEVRQMAKEEPRLVAMVVRNWVSSNG